MRAFAILVVLATVAAADPPKPAKVGAVELVELPAQPAIVKVVRAKPADLASALQKAYLSLVVVAHTAKLDVSGAPFAIYQSRGTETLVVQAGLPLSTATTSPLGDGVESITLPAGPAASVSLRGRHDQIGKAHAALDAWFAKAHRTPGGLRREVFLTNPITTPDPNAQEMRVIAPLSTTAMHSRSAIASRRTALRRGARKPVPVRSRHRRDRM